MTYAKLAPSGRVIPSIAKANELEWRLRYAPDSITKNDMLVIAHYLAQYADFHQMTQKHRDGWFKEYKEVWG